MADGTIIIDTKINADGMQAGAKEIESSCKKAASSVNKIGKVTTDAMNFKIPTEKFAEVDKEFQQLGEDIYEIERKKAALLKQGRGEKDYYFQQLNTEGEILNGMLDDVAKKRDKMIAEGKAYVKKAAPKLEMPKDEKQGGLFTGSGNAMGELAKAFIIIKAIFAIIKAIKQKIKESVENIKKIVTTVAKGLSMALKPLFKTLASIGSIMAKSIINGTKSILSVVGKIGTATAGIFINIAKFMTDTFVKALKYAFDFLKSNAKLSFDTMATQISSVNADLSTLVTSINQVKASIATMLQPFLTVAVPMFQKAIAAITAGMNTIGEFFAALTGQGYIYEATAQQEDYAASLNSTAKSAKKMTSNLSGLDKIHKWTEDSKDSDTKDNGLIPSVTYTKKEVTNSVSDFVERVKAAWESADFTSIGTTISTKLANALNSINWGVIRTNAKKVGTSLATFMNGVFGNMDFAKSIGTTIGQSVNTVVDGLDGFVSETNFKTIGEFVANIINSGFSSIDWENLGSTIGKTLNGIVDLLDGFFSETDFNAIGTSIGSTLSSAFRTLNFANIGKTIGKAINGAVNLLKGFLASTDFAALGQGVGNVFKHAFKTVGWYDLGVTIGNSLTAMIKLIYGFFSTVNLENVGRSIANLIRGAFSGIDWHLLGETIGTVINGAMSLIYGFLSTISVEKIMTSLSNFISSAFKKIKWYELGRTIGTAIKTAVNLFIGLISTIYENKDTISKSIKSLLKGAFTGIEWKTTGKEIGNSINTLSDFITEFIGTIKSEHISLKIRTMLSDALKTTDWKQVGQNVADAVNELLKMIPYEDLQNALSDFISGIMGSLDWAQIIVTLYYATNGIKDGIISGLWKAIAGDNTKTTHDKPWASSGGSVPMLASGAVIPPNAPFMAFLGDQNNGTNLEAPESLIRQIVREESGGNGSYTFVAQLDGDVIFKKVVSQAEAKKRSTGKNPLMIGG